MIIEVVNELSRSLFQSFIWWSMAFELYAILTPYLTTKCFNPLFGGVWLLNLHFPARPWTHLNVSILYLVEYGF